MNDPASNFCSACDPRIGSLRPTRGINARAAMLNAAFWGKGNRLTISFLEGDPALHRRVADIAERWITETAANIQFEFWIGATRDPRYANLRIAFRPEKGSQSVVGKLALDVGRDEATMNLGWMSLDLADAQSNAVVLHEFGHALGLIHEHLSPVQPIDWNKENVVADLRQTQGWDDATIEANMFAQYDPNGIFATDVDPLSIMMYPIPARWTNNGFSTGFNTSLTDKDRSLIVAAYGTPQRLGL
jgi:serralysin